MVRIAEGHGTTQPRFRVYGIRSTGLRVEVDTLFLRDVPEVPLPQPALPDDYEADGVWYCGHCHQILIG